MSARSIVLLRLGLASVELPALLLAGCAPSPIAVTSSRAIAAARDVIWLEPDVPVVRGAPGFGAQAMAAVLAFHDRELAASAVAEALPWHAIEATADELIAAAREAGCDARAMPPSLDGLLDEIRSGRPVLALLDERDLPDRRGPSKETPTLRGWVIVGGWCDADRTVLLARDRGRVLRLERSEFERRWRAAGRRAVGVRSGAAARAHHSVLPASPRSI